MKTHLLSIILIFCYIQMGFSQEEDGVVSLDLPIRNSLIFNRYVINPTFSFVREQNKYISINNKREWVQFEDAPETYLASYSGRFFENIGAGLAVFQQNKGVLTTFGGLLNFAYNAKLNTNSNLTFGLNIGAYKSGINTANTVTNFSDPSLQNVASNFLLTVNPGINYGTEFLDFGISINNLVLYNFESSMLIEENPNQGIQAHIMHTGYFSGRGFFSDTKVSAILKSEFKKDETIISGLAMLNVPKGIWMQLGYNNAYGASGGLGINITPQIALEYNIEKATGELVEFGSSHDITIAYRLIAKKRYRYNGDEKVSGLFSKKRKRKPTVKISQAELEGIRTRAAERRAQAKLDLEDKKKIEADTEAKAKLDAQEKSKKEAEEKAKRLEELKLKQEADKKAAEIAETRARILAKQEADAKLLEEQKAKQEAEAKLLEEQRAKAEADTQAKLLEEQKAKQEAEAKLLEEQRVKAEADAQAKLLEEQKAKQEAEAKLLEEQRVKAEADAQAKLLEEQRAKAEADAQAKLLEEQKAKQEAEAKLLEEQKALEEEEAKKNLIANPVDDLGKAMKTLANQTEDTKTTQNNLLKQFDDIVAIKDKDLKDLKEENDLSDQGITVKPKPFKSVTAENNTLNIIKSNLDDIIKTRSDEIDELQALYEQRTKIKNTELDEVNLFYKDKIKRLTEEQLKAIQVRKQLNSKLETIKVATEFEKRRRIKRAAFDNQEDKYSQDRATLKSIKQTTTISSIPLKAEDFDFGEELGNNIKILKNIKNTESGYYVVIAVHSNTNKRNDFVTKVVASGDANIDYFYDVNTSKYYIFSDKFDSIGNANEALKAKGNRPYNQKMSIVKIEN